MYITDFTYDGTTLSSKGCVVCSFNDGGGLETIGNGSVITFSTTPVQKGQRVLLADTKYDECLTTTFSICKNPCTYNNNFEFSISEERAMMKWLNRKEFKKLVLSATGYENIYFEGSFNISRVEIAGKLVGFELAFTSNRPFGIGTAVTKTFSVSSGSPYSLANDSDEIGYIYPDSMTITVLSAGNLTINNGIENNRNVVINNCSANEVITMNYPVISSSVSAHDIANDFNYNFFRLANSYSNATNVISSNLSCNITLTYSPIRKVGL